jgi:hypothetical protein
MIAAKNGHNSVVICNDASSWKLLLMVILANLLNIVKNENKNYQYLA